jgi:hypothetical protein
MFVERILGAADQPHRTYSPGEHFIQNDRVEEVAAAMMEWLAGLG